MLRGFDECWAQQIWSVRHPLVFRIVLTVKSLTWMIQVRWWHWYRRGVWWAILCGLYFAEVSSNAPATHLLGNMLRYVLPRFLDLLCMTRASPYLHTRVSYLQYGFECFVIVTRCLARVIAYTWCYKYTANVKLSMTLAQVWGTSLWGWLYLLW